MDGGRRRRGPGASRAAWPGPAGAGPADPLAPGADDPGPCDGAPGGGAAGAEPADASGPAGGRARPFWAPPGAWSPGALVTWVSDLPGAIPDSGAAGPGGSAPWPPAALRTGRPSTRTPEPTEDLAGGGRSGRDGGLTATPVPPGTAPPGESSCPPTDPDTTGPEEAPGGGTKRWPSRRRTRAGQDPNSTMERRRDRCKEGGTYQVPARNAAGLRGYTRNQAESIGRVHHARLPRPPK